MRATLGLGPFVLAIAIPSYLQAQTPGFQRLPSGIEYQLFTRANGQYVPRSLPGGTDPTFATRQGKFLLAHITYLTGKDSVIQSSRQQLRNHPAPLPLLEVTHKGGQEEALALVRPGDSAVFRFRADSLFKGRGQAPPFIRRGGNVLVMRVVGVQVASQAEAMAANAKLQELLQAEQQRQLRKQSAGQFAKDDAQIATYVAAHQLKARKLPGGTWVAVSQRGTGSLPKPGEQVQVQYRGTLLANGQEFDSSAKHGSAPFAFILGRGQVIAGWDEGIAALPRGSKATLLIPSPLAYGAMPQSGIPANSVLRFDVTLSAGGSNAPKPGNPTPGSLDWVHARMKAAPKKAASKK